MAEHRIDTDACVVGGGPAGLVLALLLVRAGVRTVVLEKHADFLRDFRGDTIHPSTATVMDELGLGERFQALPHRKVDQLWLTFADGRYRMVDVGRLRGSHPYIMFLPQWDFLEFVAAEAARWPGFTLLRSTPATGLIHEGGRVVGVTASGPDGPVEVRAALTVAADGRDSTVRAQLALPRRDFGAPMDVLWFRLPRRPEDGAGLSAYPGRGGFLVSIDRGEYWQIAYVIPKGGYDAVRAAGLPALRASIGRLAPFLADRTDLLRSWDDLPMLSVHVDRLRRWYADGVLLIGDAAHAMSPVGGVGINLAVQDAVAAARLLTGPLRAGRISTADLRRVQRRRWYPTAGTQLLQRIMQRVAIGRALRAEGPIRAPWPVRLLQRVPALQALPARVVGVGLRPEHVAPEAPAEPVSRPAG
jgi:2-polyprenyl-6-methoxyphenol hydroxylase-like FAD-dependent oxidoreductase